MKLGGRPGIDPEVAVRLMLVGFLLGIVHDRRPMREAQVNAIVRLIGALLLEQNDELAIQRSRYMTLETIAKVSDRPLISLTAEIRHSSGPPG